MKKGSQILVLIFMLVSYQAIICSAQSMAEILEQTGIQSQDIHVFFPAAAEVLLVDAHAHLNGDITATELIKQMDRAGVRWMVLMPRHYQSLRDGGGATDEQAAQYARQYSDRFIPFIGGQRGDLGARGRVWHDPNAKSGLMSELEAKLASKKYYGLGEFILRHHAYDIRDSVQGGGEADHPVDSDVMIRIGKLAAKYKVPVVLHAEAEPHVMEAMGRLLVSVPDTKFIWSHNCGRQSAESLQGMLLRHSNLMCDLGTMQNGPKTRGGYGKEWPRKSPWIHLVQKDNGAIVEEMKMLFDKMPERFLGIGTDIAHTPVFKNYLYRVQVFRVLLAQLTPEAARKIAYENALALFGK